MPLVLHDWNIYEPHEVNARAAFFTFVCFFAWLFVCSWANYLLDGRLSAVAPRLSSRSVLLLLWVGSVALSVSLSRYVLLT